jgi:hypothetical protein
MKALFLFVCGFAVLFAAPLGALPLEELVGAARAEALERGETITEVQLRNPAPALAVRNSYLQFLTGMLMADVKPSMMVESLKLYRKPLGAGGTAPAGTGGWTADERAALYNQALALSTLEGLQYYSTSRGAMRTFYETSSVIDGPDSRQPLADPAYTTPPEHITLYARQKDLTFGDNIYRYEYYARPEALILVQENITAMTVGIIPAIGRNRLRSVVAIVDAGPCLLLYTFSLAKAASLPGLGSRIGASFTTRVEAISGWFAGQADKAFGVDRVTGAPRDTE